MKKNLAYYAQNARSFFDNTVDVDMASLHEAFLSKLAPDASILDAGCGSDRIGSRRQSVCTARLQRHSV